MFMKAQPDDPYLRVTDGILKTPTHQHPFEYISSQPGPSLVRMFEYIDDRKQGSFNKYKNMILCKGAAVGLDADNHIVHFFAGRNLRFIGFMGGQTVDRADVQVRGSVVLHLEGVTDEHRGKPVYCSGPDSFSLDHKRGSVEIGKVRYAEGKDRAAVFFRSEGDVTPCYLHVN